MRLAILLSVSLLLLGCSSGDPPPPDSSAEAAQRLEAEIKAAQSKEGEYQRSKSNPKE